ncbi:MAG: hypothetical protein ACYC61_23970 [Isosphaeraceae bacterium]
MLWATGVGAEVIRPMAAPVLGGLLIADEVIDVFLPVLYFAVCKGRWRKLHGITFFNGRWSGEDLARADSAVMNHVFDRVHHQGGPVEDGNGAAAWPRSDDVLPPRSEESAPREKE